jgi:hypothetical protein
VHIRKFPQTDKFCAKKGSLNEKIQPRFRYMGRYISKTATSTRSNGTARTRRDTRRFEYCQQRPMSLQSAVMYNAVSNANCRHQVLILIFGNRTYEKIGWPIVYEELLPQGDVPSSADAHNESIANISPAPEGTRIRLTVMINESGPVSSLAAVDPDSSHRWWRQGDEGRDGQADSGAEVQAICFLIRLSISPKHELSLRI